MTDVAKQVLEKPKNTSVQDMVKIFHEEFSDIPVKLDKNLAKNLVAALKIKFENSLQKWKSGRAFIKMKLLCKKWKIRMSICLVCTRLPRL